jgi:hypothetical protein
VEAIVDQLMDDPVAVVRRGYDELSLSYRADDAEAGRYESFDAVVAFYALIHVPLEAQPALLTWLGGEAGPCGGARGRGDVRPLAVRGRLHRPPQGVRAGEDGGHSLFWARR